MVVRVYILFVVFVGLSGSSWSQVRYSVAKRETPDYCSRSSFKAKDIIGRPAKIWHEGGIYSAMNTGIAFDGLPAEWKARGGTNGWGTNLPKAGDTGTIVHIFNNRGNTDRYIYLLRINTNYVPVACNYLTDVDKPDVHEALSLHYLKDSIENINYAAGCMFKLRYVNNHWSRAGRAPIDIVAENYACGLTSRGVDTVMLCKYMSDNGVSSIEKAFVVWLESGQGYVKAFFNNEKHKPTENEVASFDAKVLLDHFFLNRLDTVSTEPNAKAWISYSMGYSIQFKIPSLFFRQRLTNFIINQDTAHPKAAWWILVSERLAAITRTGATKR